MKHPLNPQLVLAGNAPTGCTSADVEQVVKGSQPKPSRLNARLAGLILDVRAGYGLSQCEIRCKVCIFHFPDRFLTHTCTLGSVAVAILEISGILSHSEACRQREDMEHPPRIPLYPDVRKYALCLLRERALINMIRSQCKKYSSSRWGNTVGDNHYRFHLAIHDSSSLYQTAATKIDIPQRSKPEENLHRWFSPNTSASDPLLTASCLHYQPHIAATEHTREQRFELIIATPQMREAAWRHGHGQLLHMDLTFGVCTAQTLLLILLVADKHGKGIPLAYIIFTAQNKTKAVHANYNTALLTHLLERYRAGMGVNAEGLMIMFRIAMLDMNPCKFDGLSTNFDLIFILICIFHVWQAWRNGLTKYLGSVSKGEPRQDVRKQLGNFLICLMRDIVNYNEACQLYNNKISFFTVLSRNHNITSRKQGIGALSFLAYFKRYVKTYNDWLPWSPAGPIKAGEILGKDPTTIPCTNNMLEGFNGRIKGKHFAAYLHSGRLPRIDVWVLILITDVMPGLFKELSRSVAQQDY